MKRTYVLVGLIVVLGCKRGDKTATTTTTVSSSSVDPAKAFEDDDEEADDKAAAEDAKHFTNQKTDKGFADAKTPPPPVVHKTTTTKADLPPIGKQQRVAIDTPTKPTDDGCGEIMIGKTKVELDCMDDNYGKIENTAQPLVGYAEIGQDDSTLPEVVDHREDGTEGPVRNQGRTLTCTAFSLATALDHDAAELTGKPGSLSPMHLWSRYHTPNMRMAELSNEGKPISDITIFPFDETLANKWEKGQNLDPKKFSAFDQKAAIRIKDVTAIQPTEIKQAIASGQDIWFAMRAAHNLQKPTGKPGFKYVADFDYRTSKQAMGHAMVLSGYRVVGGETYYLIHNSWGDDWGDGGYAYIHESTLMRNISSAYSVDAVMADEKTQRTPIPTTRQHMCKADLVPDSVTGQCTPKCSDGSPRHNGVCPEAKSCPKGQVNVEGECVRAAKPGVYQKNGVTILCALGGCVYKYPNGTAGCTKAKGCETSCASPKFRLAATSRGAICTE